jgi:DNA-binding transcriptional regulator GbsR (MarR family)
MTEINDKSAVADDPLSHPPLHPVVERFVLHWGEMGGQWSVNRSVAQIHALLYLSERPLTADDIASMLGMARSNVSNSIKELLGWDLIRRVPIRGERREHFEAETDVWEIAAHIAAGRKAREIDPAIATLRGCIDEAQGQAGIHPVAVKRLKEMLAFTEALDTWHAQMSTVPRSTLAALMRLGTKVIKYMPFGKTK